MKTCQRCGEEKPLEEFYRSHARCKSCLKSVNNEWRVKHRDRYLAARRARKAANPAAVVAEREAMKDYYRNALREWRTANRDRFRAQCRRRRARMQGAKVVTFTAADWNEMKAYYIGRCGYCLQVASLTQDHIKPLVAGGVHTADNIVPACQSCNSAKSTRSLIEFLRYQVAKGA